MRTVELVLPKKSCSTCDHWCSTALGVINEDKVLTGICAKVNKSKSGGESCSKWEKKERKS